MQKIDTSPNIFFVAGVQYRPNWEMVTNNITDEDQKDCKLIGEPGNAFDRYAVKIFLGPHHIGYVPRPINTKLWTAHNAGYRFTTRLIKFNQHTNPWEIYQISVSFTEPETLPCPIPLTTPTK